MRFTTHGIDLADTAGNLHLRQLVGCLRVVADVAESFADKHAPDCRCAFCDHAGAGVTASIWPHDKHRTVRYTIVSSCGLGVG